MDDGNPDAGWYADPLDVMMERYWDGAGWTQDTRPLNAVAAASPPEPEAAPPNSSAGGPSLKSDGAAYGSSPLSQTRKIAIAAVAVVILLLAGVKLVGGSHGRGVRLIIEDRPDRSGGVHMVSPGEVINSDNEILGETGQVWSPRLTDLQSGAMLNAETTFLEFLEEGSTTRKFGYVANGEFVSLIRLRDADLQVRLASDNRTYVLSPWSYSDIGASCFVGQLEELVEIRTRDGCTASNDGSVFLTTEYFDGSVRYEVVDRNDDTILDGISGDDPVLSTDGRYLATVRNGARQELEIWDLSNGEKLPPDTRADDITISAMIGSRAIVSAWDDSSHRADILLVDANGTETELTRSESPYSRVLTQAGIVGVSGNNKTTIFAVASGEELGSIRADRLKLTDSGDGRWMVFAVSGDRVDVLWAKGATMPVEVGSHRVRNGQPVWAYFGNGNSGAYQIEGWNDSRTDAVLARVDGTSEATILEEDLSLSTSWISPDASQILAVNSDNGDELMLIRPGERSKVLDDDDNIFSVNVLSGSAYYTASHNDRTEIRTVRISAGSRPETLFEDASLITIERPERQGTMRWLQGE